ncbi:hypothetical protein [Streptomyces atratus]|uniref:hypothetical protein n=1 Tax=Streptomyces atratus TaxID=1893 RepID=UPI0033EF5849
MGVSLSNSKSRRAKLTADNLAALATSGWSGHRTGDLKGQQGVRAGFGTHPCP